MRDLPVRGEAVRHLGLRLPPSRMAPLQAGRPLKRWRYVGVYRPDLMLCVGDARVAGVRQRWWAVALPDGSLEEGRRGVRLGTGRVEVGRVIDLQLDEGAGTGRVEAGRVIDLQLDEGAGTGRVEASGPVIDLQLDEGAGVEVVSPHGRGWVWTRKQAGVPVRGRVRAGGRTYELSGPDGFIDDSAGYHARHTSWRWSAGVGRAEDGRRVAWNLVDGVHDLAAASERTVWVDDKPHEVPPQKFAADLSRVGELEFREWSAREARMNLGIMRNRYRQPFGEFSGRLPGDLPLREGYGVMEEHDVRW